MQATQALTDKWEKHDGAMVTLDGLSCKLQVTRCHALYPVEQVVFNVEAVPTATGELSAEFRRIDAKMRGGPWTIDVLESDLWVQTAILEQLI